MKVIINSLSFSVNQCAIKGILIGITLVAISHSTTHYMITSYAVTIFQTLDSPKLDPNVASIVLAVALILGSLTTTTLADILGRKILILISLLVSLSWMHPKLKIRVIIVTLSYLSLSKGIGMRTICHSILWLFEIKWVRPILIHMGTSFEYEYHRFYIFGRNNPVISSC